MTTFNEIKTLIKFNDMPTIVSLLNYLRSSKPELFVSVQAHYLIKRLQAVNSGALTLDDLKQELIDAKSTGTIADISTTEIIIPTTTFTGFLYYDDSGTMMPLIDTIIQIDDYITITDNNGYFNIITKIDYNNTPEATISILLNDYTSKIDTVRIYDKYINLGNIITYQSTILAGDYASDTASNVLINSIAGSSASLEIIANGVVDLNGDLYSGNVNVYGKLSLPSESTFNNELPIKLEIENSILFSFGAILIELQDDSGNKLELNGTDEAVISIPIIDPTNAINSIKLYYFDDVLNKWVENGVATMNADNDKYLINVSHCGLWVCAIPLDSELIEFKIECDDANTINYPLDAIMSFTDATYNVVLSKKINICDGDKCNIPVDQHLTFNTINNDIIGHANITTSDTIEVVVLNESICNEYTIKFDLYDENNLLVTDDSNQDGIKFIFNDGLDGFTNDNNGTYSKLLYVNGAINSSLYIGTVIKILNNATYIGNILSDNITIDETNNIINLGSIYLTIYQITPQYTIIKNNSDIIYKSLLIPIGNADESIQDNIIKLHDDSNVLTRNVINTINNIDFNDWIISIPTPGDLISSMRLTYTEVDDNNNDVELFNLNNVTALTVSPINKINTSLQGYISQLFGLYVPANNEFIVNILKTPYTEMHTTGTIIQHVEFDIIYNNGAYDIKIEVRL